MEYKRMIMKIKSIHRFVRGIYLVVWLLGMFGTAAAGDVVITHATIVTVTGGTVENGTLLIQGDRIAALGTDVDVPPGVEIIDARGLYVYPGMIDATTSLGLYEVGAVRATVDASEMGTYNPHIEAAIAINRGVSPMVLEESLKIFLSPKERQQAETAATE